ncbi:MAG TPA: amidohydrolase family protein [Streptosporangiaceae bacterium]|jgi:predicted TIM-barrel fold metal-dependent hydrolase
MTTATLGPGTGSQERVDVNVVDCDVHLTHRHADEMLQYVPEPWRSQLGARRGTNKREAYTQFWDPRRLDSYGTPGLPAGSEPDLVHRQLFDEAGVDLAMILAQARCTVDPEINAALCRGANAWLANTWLAGWNLGDRFYGSINVPMDNPDAAVREIEEWAGHPKFKQILIGHFSDRPLGYPGYDKVWEAASRHRLPVAMHFSVNAGDPLGATPTGRFQHHVDYHSIAFSLTYSAHFVSWLCSGAFDRYPNLQFVLVEGGFLWHRALISRLARHWKTFQDEIPAAAADPVSYLRDHIRFTTQPIEESEDPSEVTRALEATDAENILMFSTDYPHFDFDDPKRALPPGLDPVVRQRIMAGNACDFYGLPRSRVVTPPVGQGSVA